MPKEEAQYHMQRCIDSGLWVPDAKAAGERERICDCVLRTCTLKIRPAQLSCLSDLVGRVGGRGQEIRGVNKRRPRLNTGSAESQRK